MLITTKRKCNNYWTKEKCHEEALKYKTRNDFSGSTAYNVAHKKGWIDEITSHMSFIKRHNYWTKEKCKETALQYTSKSEFIKKEPACYHAIHRKGWAKELLSHQINKFKPSGYWTKEKCHEEALKYKTRMEFKNNMMAAYHQAVKHKWLNDICSHMDVIGNCKVRFVYVFEFDDNHVYVGLTFNIRERYNQHMTNSEKNTSMVFKHISETNSKFVFKVLTENPIPVKLAGLKEKLLIAEYSKNGWAILNKTKGGDFGGKILYWTKDKCQIEALKYNTRAELKKYANGCYHSARKKNFLDEICQHMLKPHECTIKWTKETLSSFTQKHTKSELRKHHEYVYKILSLNNWFEEFYP
jgi:hypothetical protein